MNLVQREELRKLMLEIAVTLQKHTFLDLTDLEFEKQENKIKRVRELCAELLAALRRSTTKSSRATAP